MKTVFVNLRGISAKSYAEAGRKLGLSRERVRQIMNPKRGNRVGN